jgi:hypothetical protein
LAGRCRGVKGCSDLLRQIPVLECNAVARARTQATDVFLDRRLFVLDDEQYESFVNTLEEPPAPNEKLKRLLASKSPWET